MAQPKDDGCGDADRRRSLGLQRGAMGAAPILRVPGESEGRSSSALLLLSTLAFGAGYMSRHLTLPTCPAILQALTRGMARFDGKASGFSP